MMPKIRLKTTIMSQLIWLFRYTGSLGVCLCIFFWLAYIRRKIRIINFQPVILDGMVTCGFSSIIQRPTLRPILSRAVLNLLFYAYDLRTFQYEPTVLLWADYKFPLVNNYNREHGPLPCLQYI